MLIRLGRIGLPVPWRIATAQATINNTQTNSGLQIQQVSGMTAPVNALDARLSSIGG